MYINIIIIVIIMIAESMVGDVNLFFMEEGQQAAEVEIMIAGSLCTSTHVWVCVCVCLCVCACACMCVCMHACVRVCVRTLVCVGAYVCTHAQAHALRKPSSNKKSGGGGSRVGWCSAI